MALLKAALNHEVVGGPFHCYRMGRETGPFKVVYAIHGQLATLHLSPINLSTSLWDGA